MTEESDRSGESTWRSEFSEDSRLGTPTQSNPSSTHLLQFWRERSPSIGSVSSEDDVDFSIHQGGAPAANPSDLVPTNQERQILLLMLLAQVCALTDPTPRTFTVHVLELFERGILDRDSIVFLFDLGLVPSTTGSAPARLLTAAPHSSPQVAEEALAAPNQHHVPFRIIEASSIRKMLEQQEAEQQHPGSPTSSPSNRLSWSAENYPLHLSRFQREFTQLGMIASGAFGQVYRCLHNTDGKVYAVKCVQFQALGFENHQVEQVIQEIVCLAHCHSRHVVRYYTSWLEPSWMTGNSEKGSAGPVMLATGDSVERPQVPRRSSQKLLTDVHRVVNRESPSEILKHDWDSSHGRHRRRSSFDVSERYAEIYDEEDEDSLFDRSCQSSRDDLYVNTKWAQSNGGVRVRNQKLHVPVQQKRRSSYRYQICLYIQMELCHQQTLAHWIRDAKKEVWEDRCARGAKIFLQVCNGLAHVHSKEVVHRDIKPSNIFRDIDDLDIYKIGDFGLSKRLESIRKSSPRANSSLLLEHQPNEGVEELSLQDPLTAGVGTASYAAPEQVSSTRYGKEADIFSLGLILLEILCPFGTEHERIQTFRAVRYQRQVPSFLKEKKPRLADIILKCTDPLPERRPTAIALCSLQVLTGSSESRARLVPENDRIVQLEGRVKRQEEDLINCRELIARQEKRIQELEAELGDVRRSGTQPRIEIPADFLSLPVDGSLVSGSLGSQSSGSSSDGGV